MITFWGMCDKWCECLKLAVVHNELDCDWSAASKREAAGALLAAPFAVQLSVANDHVFGCTRIPLERYVGALERSALEV